MAFAQRFNEVRSDITHISELEVDVKYPIEHANRVQTRFGDTVLLSIRDTGADCMCTDSFHNVTAQRSRTTTYKPLMKCRLVGPVGVWCRRDDVPIPVPTSWLSMGRIDTFHVSDGPGSCTVLFFLQVEAAC